MGNSYAPVLYTDEENLEVFGIKRPLLAQRAEYYDKAWDDWADNEIILGEDYLFKPHTLRAKLGSYNFVVHGKRIRFKDKETLVRFLFDL